MRSRQRLVFHSSPSGAVPVAAATFAVALLALQLCFGGASSQSPEEELVYLLPGFSVQSGVRVGEVYDPNPPPAPPPPPPAAENATEEELSKREAEITRIAIEYQKTLDEHARGPPVVFSTPVSGNDSEFSICLRFKPHFQRPEYVLFSSYSINKTAVVIGIDETAKELYFRYSKSAESAELTRVTFDLLPRLDVWEHVCFVKGPDDQAEGEGVYKKLKFFYNGMLKGEESSVTAQLDDLTLVVLGQSDPPSIATSFSGEISHFAIWNRPLTDQEVEVLALCGQEYYNLARQGATVMAWAEGVWHQMVQEGNDTEVNVDPLALPTGMYYDWREVCRQVDNKKDKTYLLPIYRKKSKEYHEELCTFLGGEIPDLVNFGKDGSEKREGFVRDIFLSARIPTVLEPTKPPVEPDEAPKDVTELLEQALLEESKPDYVTPLNMQSCFVNDEFVVWVENSESVPRPPLSRGAAKGLPKGTPQAPIDPKTGKPLFGLVGHLGATFGPGGGGGGGGGKKGDKECPYHVLYNGTAVKKCGNDPTACSVCLMSRKRPSLRARGLCEKSWLRSHRRDGGDGGSGQEEFDTAFYPKADKLTGETVFRGPLGSHIYKNVSAEESDVVDRNGDWILESLVSPWRDASRAIIRKIPATKLPVGRHTWSMETDVCDSDEAEVALTSCKKDKFTCKSGKCIPLSYRCDIYTDCEDNEDEENCDILTLEDSYSEAIAPRHTQKGVPWPVYIGIEIVSFPQILAIEQKFAADFYLTLRWEDNRLAFKNLKQGKFDNPLSPEVTQALWVPRLSLLNGLSEFQTIVTEEDAEFYRGYVWKRGKARKSGFETSIEDEVFKGKGNPILLLREFYQEFTCHFDLLWYPFDKQTCYMNFTVQGQTAKSLILRADNKVVNYLGQEFLVEYKIVGQNLIVPVVTTNDFATATVELIFQRRVVYHLLNIFLQSFFLVLTGYMSLFFSVSNFSDRVMVALTVMLVMASLQSSVQDSLPKTAYFKFIDWWILFSLNTQIWIMAFHTFQGIYANKEYQRYKEAMMLKVVGPTAGAGAGANGPPMANADSKISVMTASTSGSAIYEDEILSAEEFDYPKTTKLNKVFNLGFLILLTAFNVVYWSIAMGVYFA